VRGRRHATPDQPSIFEARRTSLNGAAGIEKTFLRTRVSLTDVKRAAKARGVSVTDFVMATTSGALSKLMDERGESLSKDLFAFVPINVRAEGDSADLGNQISGMLVQLHTEISDPEERVRAISHDSSKTVDEQRAHRARIFQDVPRVLGPTLVSFGGKLVSAFGLFDHLPMANVMISSVAGTSDSSVAERPSRRCPRRRMDRCSAPFLLTSRSWDSARIWSLASLAALNTWPILIDCAISFLKKPRRSLKRRRPRNAWTSLPRRLQSMYHADVAQLVERDLAKVEVAGSSPVVRSNSGAIIAHGRASE
jgi:hypothetical protein